MKVLYAVQATGNGHLSRCMEFYPAMSRHAEVDVLLSGIQGDLRLPFPVKYRMHGLSFIFGTRGGIDYIKTALSLKPFRFLKDLISIDLSEYDLIINDFEPITAWACKFKNKTCVALSHQAAFLSNKTPRPSHKNWLAEFIFKRFAPAHRAVGLHYKKYDHHIHTPVVRSEIRDIQTSYVDDEIIVYLPAYSEEFLIEKFAHYKNFKWRIFSKHTHQEYQVENIFVYPVGAQQWNRSMSIAPRAIIGGGFEGPSEMLFLKKKIIVVPMTDQYEQLCNAAALKAMGVRIVYDVAADDFHNQVDAWLQEDHVVEVDFPRMSDHIVKVALGIVEESSDSIKI